MSKQQRYTSNAFVMTGFIAILASAALVVAIVGSTIPQASADPRFPISQHQAEELGQPRWHCQGNPHSDEPTGNPHDVGEPDSPFTSNSEQQNPHDDVECTLR
jgi:hypothetical protein